MVQNHLGRLRRIGQSRQRLGREVQIQRAPTDTNNDVDGSQHNGDIDFTYEDATEANVHEATNLGYYEYFSQYGFGTYTGHYYNGSDDKFAAIVINPLAYAATVQI